MAVLPFWQQLVLNAVGPLISVIVGSLIVGVLVQWITRRAQNRREDRQLRDQLIGRVTETASLLHFEIQRYFRAKNRERRSRKELVALQQELEQAFLTCRREGTVLENRLLAYFASDEPRRLWHQVIDRLSVRYYFQIGALTPKLLAENVGSDHSGLEVEDLKDVDSVAKGFGEHLKRVTRAILDERFRHPTLIDRIIGRYRDKTRGRVGAK